MGRVLGLSEYDVPVTIHHYRQMQGGYMGKVLTKAKTCAYRLCTVSFTPMTNWHEYHSTDCRAKARKEREMVEVLDRERQGILAKWKSGSWHIEDVINKRLGKLTEELD